MTNWLPLQTIWRDAI